MKFELAVVLLFSCCITIAKRIMETVDHDKRDAETKRVIEETVNLDSQSQ